MTLFIISIPFMLIGVAIAVVPLVATSRREVRQIAAEFEQYRARRRSPHAGHRHTHVPHRHDRSGGHVPAATERRPWHEPVLIRHESAVAQRD
jgi:hypothetical protein